jgi:hypothetical protein
LGIGIRGCRSGKRRDGGRGCLRFEALRVHRNRGVIYHRSANFFLISKTFVCAKCVLSPRSSGNSTAKSVSFSSRCTGLLLFHAITNWQSKNSETKTRRKTKVLCEVEKGDLTDKIGIQISPSSPRRPSKRHPAAQSGAGARGDPGREDRQISTAHTTFFFRSVRP